MTPTTRHGHKRRVPVKVRALLATAALLLGGGGTALVAADASAGGTHRPAAGGAQEQAAATATTIACPDVGDRLQDVPAPARQQVSAGLAELDAQIARAYEKAAAPGGDSGAVLGELKQQRSTTIGRMADAIGEKSARPAELTELSACRTQQVRTDAARGASGAPVLGRPMPGGPSPADFADIRTAPARPRPATRAGGSAGTFTSACGRNENGHFNSDNVIVTPGVSNGAHHTHDYVGNLSTNAFSTDASLAAAGTTCTNGDLSTHYWPVLRLLDGKAAPDADKPGGGHDGNMGKVLRPSSVTLQFRGSPVAKVSAMPRFLRVITGDAKAFTSGPANANASWSCVGFEERQFKDKYPICPRGAEVVRTLAFQSCWDGRSTDSANHRTHVAFARQDGSCPRGFRAVPQLVQRITYQVPSGTPFAVDSFPEQLHKPVTDHGDFINVMPDALMAKAVACVNSGRRC
ncbi:hypothetical protein BLA24_05780 [Streptomyces cinnamoneus]|uniref:DUF1996 domain-containing protein n=1 Tax=Streptomyces cinnamoneus TaxID=53446 RepID=A0A2G1XNE5_STRCJ|nr:DUF1996 domain-containing protein [Streptomyces cinnamoneus]PHQ52774.1 hypothetical protein BLA24_05780 [Streptomyces cinnamoneus]PPT11875.1 DUF1996 domain-containing protein [Streptomyces cinnamoneus]